MKHHYLAYQIMTNAYETGVLKWASNVEAYREDDDGELVTTLRLEIDPHIEPRYIHTINFRKVLKALKEMVFDTSLPTLIRLVCGEMYERNDYDVPHASTWDEEHRDELDGLIIRYVVDHGKDW